MTFDFDTPVDRRDTGSTKWSRYGADVLPLWVADMDFPLAPAIVDALKERLDHPFLGYATPRDELRDAVVAHLSRTYGWEVSPDWLVFLPGVVPGFNMALKGCLSPGDGLIIERPVYPPIRAAAGHWDLRRIEVDIVPDGDRWRLDLDAIAAAAPTAGAILLCNPQNPTGLRVPPADLERLAAIAVEHDLLMLSDEVHCDLMLADAPHVPIASLGKDIASRTVTLMAASKTFNIAGLKTAFAVIENAELRRRVAGTTQGMVDSINAFGFEGTLAALRDGRPWHDALIAYLRGNRDHLASEIARRFPKIAMRVPDATFLAWLDCAALDLGRPAQEFFLHEAKVGLSPGSDFGGPAMADHCRLNFGCPRALLDEALTRMEAALNARS
ncbi:MAG: PatB family C-S lyase [Pseudomonadota bacterium]